MLARDLGDCRDSDIFGDYAGNEPKSVLVQFVQRLYKIPDNIFLLLQILQRNVIIKETKKLKIVSGFPKGSVVQEDDGNLWTGGSYGRRSTAAVTAENI